jgi:antitoxin component of MazEF toxin-antitoxin module
LALRIPKAFAEETRLEGESTVKICVVNGQIRVIPMRETLYDLEALLMASRLTACMANSI